MELLKFCYLINLLYGIRLLQFEKWNWIIFRVNILLYLRDKILEYAFAD